MRLLARKVQDHWGRIIPVIECFGEEEKEAKKHEGVADGGELEYPAPSKKLSNESAEDGRYVAAIC